MLCDVQVGRSVWEGALPPSYDSWALGNDTYAIADPGAARPKYVLRYRLGKALPPTSLASEETTTVKAKLAAVDAALRSVHSSAAEAEDKVRTKASRAIAAIHSHTKDQIDAIIAIEVDLRRQLNDIERGQSKIHTTKDPMLRQAWERRLKQNEEVDDDVRSAVSKVANLDIRGDLIVVLDAEEEEEPKKARCCSSALSSSRHDSTTSEEEDVLASRTEANSLRGLSDRKRRQLILPGSTAFPGSRLLSRNDARALDAVIPMTTPSRLAFTTALTLTQIQRGDAPVHSVAAVNAALTNKADALFVARAGEYTFGAYVPGPWMTDCPIGSHRAFLFSISRDLKLPYHGGGGNNERRHHPPGQNDDDADRYACVMASDTRIEIGHGDLVIAGPDFASCSSRVEESFGIGLLPGSPEACTLLAGAETFQIDELEVWAHHAIPLQQS